jgi:nucleoside-diphosphate-sugar epimerase
MKILITGATGELGADLVNFMIKKNHKIYATYRNIKKKKINTNKNLFWIKHDFSKKLLKNPKVDIVINCIAAHNFSKKRNFTDLVESNIVALKNIIKYAEDNKIKLIFNLSTVSIYGKIENSNLTEEYIPKNQDNLGLTKFCGESLLFNSSINYINLRLPGVLTLSKNFNRPWLKTIIRKIKNNEPINIYNHKKNFNNVIDVYEINRFINFFLEKKLFKKKIQRTFNLSALKPINMIDIIKVIKKYYLSNSKIMIRKNIMNSYTVNISKICKQLNFFPSTTLNIIKRNLL